MEKMLEELKSDDEWPTWDEKSLVADVVEVVVQVNGKLRARVMVPTADAEDKEKLEAAAKSDEKIKQILSDNRMNPNARFVDMALSTTGLQISRS